MCNLIILLVIYALYKLIILVIFGYLTFRRVDRPDCYAAEDNDKPLCHRNSQSDINVTYEYMFLITVTFWLTVLQLIVFIPAIKSSLAQKILLLLFVPEVCLFVFLATVVFSR